MIDNLREKEIYKIVEKNQCPNFRLKIKDLCEKYLAYVTLNNITGIDNILIELQELLVIYYIRNSYSYENLPDFLKDITETFLKYHKEN